MQQKIGNFFNRAFALLCLVLLQCLIAPVAFGQGVTFPSREQSTIITPSMLSPVTSQNVFYVQNDARSQMLSDPSFGSKVKYKSNQTFVRFAINHNLPTMTFSSYTYKLVYKIDGSNKLSDSTYNFSATDTLTISYNPDSLSAFQDVQWRNYAGLYNAKLSILQLYDVSSGTPVALTFPTNTQNYTIELAMQYQPYEKTHYLPADMTLSVSNSYDPGSQQLTVSWRPTVAPYLSNVMPATYELEWTYVDDYPATPGSPIAAAQLNYNFKNNATRVLTDSLNYSIPVIYPRGYIVYRVRMVRVDSTQYKIPVYGIWNGAPPSGTASTTYAYRCNAHMADTINWNYTISFAEGGKYKHVVGYFDGMLKNRQTITRFNSTPGLMLVTENIYDYEGRPSIVTLPSVVTSKLFQYQSGVSTSSITLKPYGPLDFDQRLFTCPAEMIIPPFKDDALANKYYSVLNTDTNGMQKFVPRANGYPFVHTRLSAGFADRVDKQGGAGDKLQIGMGHETINEYTDADQTDLNRLFGVNVGFKNFYNKTVTTDPNGQLSMLIKDYQGRQIETSLIGASVDTSVTAIMYNDEVPNAAMARENVLANSAQLISGHQRIFNGNFYMDYAAGVQVEYDYSFTPYMVCPAPNYLGLSVKGSYDYTVTDACGIQKMHEAGVLGTTGVVTSPTQAPVTAIANATLDKGKYTVDKTLSIATDEIYAAVDSFFAHKPNCAKTEDDFIKQEVESQPFPCPGNPNDPCAALAKNMMEQLFPNAKYGNYTMDNNGVVTTSGNPQSIFDRIKKQVIPGHDTSYFRYQSDCVFPEFDTLKINVFGHTYTHLENLPIDSFIYVYTYAGANKYTIAHALLPLHPEYCQLQGCFIDTFETRLKSIPDAIIAKKYGLFSLDSIVQKDTLLRYKCLQFPISMVHIADSLKLMYGGTTRMDTLASELAFCLSDDTLVYAAAKKTFHSQIVNLQFPSSSVANYYFDKLRGLYLANREKYKTIAQTGGGNTCGPCQDDRMTLSPPPLVTVTYNNNGTVNMGPNGLLGLFSSNMQGALAAVMNSNAATYTSQDSINKYQDSSNKVVHAADSTLSYIAVDSIMGRLVNCIANPTQQTALKNALISLYLNGTVHNGVFLPEQVRSAIVSAGIPLSDLCHPYLVSYDYYDDGMGQKGGCQSDTWYNAVATFFSTGDINQYLTQTEDYPQVFSLNNWSPVGNLFAEQLDDSLQGTGTMQMMTVYDSTDKVYQIAFFRAGGPDSIIFSMRSPGDVTVPGSPGSPGTVYPLFKTSTGGSLLFSNISCFFQDPTAFADGHIGRFLFRATVSRTDMYGSNQFQTTSSQMLGWNNGRIFMNTIGGNKIANCIPATQFRAAFVNFADSMKAYGGFGGNHPLFLKSLRNFMNYNLKKIFTEDQYGRFLNSCALADSMRIAAYDRTYTSVVFINGMSFATFRQNIAQTYGFIVKPLSDYIFNGQEYVSFDYRSIPYNLYSAFFNTLVATPGAYLPAHSLIPSRTGGRLYLPASVVIDSVLAGTQFTTSVGSGITMLRNNNQYSYKLYTINGSGLTPSQVNVSAYMLQQNLYNKNIQGYWQPYNFATANADYFKPEKKQLLNYTYAMQSLSPAKVLDSLQDFYLHSNVPAFMSGDVSYNDPSNPDRFTNLYYTDGASFYPGDSVLNKMLGWAKTTLGPNKLFIATNTNTVHASGVPSPGYMNMYRCSDGLYWYRYFDGYNKLYNVYVRVPQYVYDNAVPNLTVAAVSPSNGDSVTRRFKLTLLNGTDTVYADGSMDFDLAWSKKLSDVLLGNEDAQSDGDPQSGIVGAPNNCEQQLLTNAILAGKMDYVHYIDSFRTALKAAFYAHVMGQLNEKLWIEYIDKRFATTLYNYDLAGNLTQTVPPEGVRKLDSVIASHVDSFRVNNMYVAAGIPMHQKMTRYVYNTINKPTLENTPDAGDKKIYYDSKGNVILSQNAKQRPLGLFTYMLYDGQNRVTETGEVQWGDCPVFADAPLFRDSAGVKVKTPKPSNCACENYTDSLWQYCVPNYSGNYQNIAFANSIRMKSRTQVVETVYDSELFNLGTIAGMTRQQNLRSRIAATMYFEYCAPNYSGAAPTSGYVHASHYSYDEQGNVQTVVQEIPELDGMHQRYKRIDYEYDLLSGKVDMISYNRGFADQLYQRYSYDADNRITKAETSHDGFIWNRDAEYTYYQHGPLARVSLGDQRVQGIDYAYTLQGWLKSINADYNDTAQDQGGDGRHGMVTPADVFSTGINYFAGDYQPIGNTPVSNLPQQPKNLYNGNIARTTNGVANFDPLTTQYTYDQLNRLRYANNGVVRSNVITFNNWYASSYKYDQDGNIKQLTRHLGNGTTMDSMSYVYQNPKNNRLTDVLEYAPLNQSNLEDIKPYTTTGATRFMYDENGNLIKDGTSNTDTVKWNIYGKTTDLLNNGKALSLHFLYDAKGDRIAKKQTTTTDTGSYENNTYYLRDAQGNILAEYNAKKSWTKPQKIILVKHLYDEVISLPPFNPGGWVWGLNQLGYTTDPAFANYVIGLGGNVTQSAGYYYSKDPALVTRLVYDMEALQALTDYSAAQSKYPAADAMAYDIWNTADPEIMNRLATNIFSNTDGEMRLHSANQLATTTPAFVSFMVKDFGIDPNDQDKINATITQLANDKPDYFSNWILQSFNNGTEQGTYMPWLQQAMSDPQYLTSNDLVKGGYVTDLETVLDKFSYNVARDAANSNGTNIEDEGLFAFTNWWPGAMDRVPEEDKQPLNYYDDPVAYIQTLSNSMGLSFTQDATALVANFDILNMGTMYQIDVVHQTWYSQYGEPQLKNQSINLASHHIYGSSRIGIDAYWPQQYASTWDFTNSNIDTVGLNTLMPWYSSSYNDVIQQGQTSAYGNGLLSSITAQYMLGQKQYELTNHLGNVQATVSDKRFSKDLNDDGQIDFYRAEIPAAYDYYPFGQLMPDRYVQDTAKHCTLVTQTQMVAKWVDDRPRWWDWLVPTGDVHDPFINTDLGSVSWTYFGDGAQVLFPYSVVPTIPHTLGFTIQDFRDVPFRVSTVETIDGIDRELSSLIIDHVGDYSLDFVPHGGTVNVVWTKAISSPPTVTLTVLGLHFGHWTYEPGEVYVQICNSRDAYEFGFNGKYKDNEIAGTGNHYDYGERGYDSRLARFTSRDPLAHKFPMLTPYQFCSLNPIMNVDLDGREGLFFGVAEMVEVGGDVSKVGLMTEDAIISRPAPAPVTPPSPSPSLSEWSVGPGGQFVGPAAAGSGAAGGTQPLLLPRTIQLPQDNLKPQPQPQLQQQFKQPIVSPKSKEKDDDEITLYRGVGNAVSPSILYPAAQKGIAVPLGYLPPIYKPKPHSSPIEHTHGDNNSIFTSWSDDENIAKKFALGQGSTEGVILKKTFKRSDVIKSPLYNEYKEGEYIVPGMVTGAATEKVTANPQTTKP